MVARFIFKAQEREIYHFLWHKCAAAAFLVSYP